MTRSSTKELLSPFKNLKQKFHSKRRLFDTPSLIESNIPEFDHNFDIEEQSEEEGQFLKELRDNTFSGSEYEDANEHIKKVLEIVDLFHIPKVTQDQIMLRAFPVSLTGAASRWLRNQPSGSITTWEVLKTKFLNKYYPPARTAKKMKEINNFQQEPDESLFRAWERFKELLMKCPQHYLTDMQEVILFYNRLDVPTRQILDSKGAIPSKTVVDTKIAI
ncbi:retrovirus-related pol polyprotein from transposon TNT 1-94 [Tanacetum coccineum]